MQPLPVVLNRVVSSVQPIWTGVPNSSLIRGATSPLNSSQVLSPFASAPNSAPTMVPA